MSDAYEGLDELYLSMVSPEEANAQDINDPVLSRWIAGHLDDGASILDAGCGPGFQVLALHRGLPAKQTGKHFVAYGSDASDSMVANARARGVREGNPAARYRLSTWAGLKDIASWANKFDAVTVNYAIYTFPDAVSDYDAYFLECVAGIDGVLKDGGHFLFNTRNWTTFRALGRSHFEHDNEHDGVRYECTYDWTFGADRSHRATVTMLNAATNLKRTTELNFAERTQAEIAALLTQAGHDVELIEADEYTWSFVSRKR